MNAGIITLEFTETVQTSSINYTALTLFSGVVASPNHYTLTGGNVLSNDSTVVVINMTTDDLNAVKKDQFLCVAISLCYVRIDSTFITDISDNPVVSVLPGSFDGLAEGFTQDTSAPQLLEYSLDLNSNVMSFTFDEPINYLSFSPVELTIANSANVTLSYQLTGGQSLVSSNDLVYSFMLVPNDVTAIKAMENLASSGNDTFINFTSNLVDDLAIPPNSIDTTVLADGTFVNDFIPDVDSPNLDTF